MKKLFTFLFATLCGLSTIYATDYTIETLPAPATPVLSKALPLVPQTSTGSSVTQQLYMASELTALGATAGDITGIKFYYGGYNNNTAVPSVTRTIKVYITELATDSLEIYEIEGAYVTNYRFKFKNPGTSPVYDGTITTEAIAAGEVKALSINFNQSSYAWDGSKNILVTVYDVTNTAYTSTEANLRLVLKTTELPRFVHYYWTAAGDHNASEYLGASLNGMVGESFTSGSTGTAKDKQVRGHRFIPKTTFSISTTIPAPTGLTASSVTTNSAHLSWTAVDGATGYNVQWGTSAGSMDHSASNVTNTYLDIDELVDGTTYYFAVQTITAGGTSAYSDAEDFETEAVIINYDDIDFSKWNSTDAMPTSGNYYLSDDVAFDIMSSDVTLTGNLNLCLNGHTADLYGSKIIVPDGKTLTIYDNEGGGKITGFVASQVGAADIYAKALIAVYSGGALVLKEGTIENTYIPDGDGSSYAIYSNGTIHLSGDVLINSNNTDIYLYSSNVITLDGAISNVEKHTVYKAGGDFTSGWSTYMSGEDPRDYFESSNSARSVCLNEGEASLRLLLNLSESSQNSSISTSYNQVADVNLTRSLTKDQYNTFCLPFALSNAQLEDIFGAGYDLEEFVSSELEDDELTLTFNKVTALEAGKPYLIQPSVNVTNPSFEGVTITATSPVDQEDDTYISFHGTFKPTELEGDNHNLLFLGEDNTLYWPETTGNLKGFRAYFEVKGSAQPVAKRARIVKEADAPTDIENQKSEIKNQKYIKDGHLFILRDGKTYNILGQKD